MENNGQGPTKILPFLYLGSQKDAFNKKHLIDYNITYQLNVSIDCPKPDFISDSNFMRIPIQDNYCDELLPFLPQAFEFLDKVRASGACVLVHCFAGISRSATVAISYVMRDLKLSFDYAYRYVKSKRDTISPNFNFLGQLLEFEKQLRSEILLNNFPLDQIYIINNQKSLPSTPTSSNSHQTINMATESFTSSNFSIYDLTSQPNETKSNKNILSYSSSQSNKNKVFAGQQLLLINDVPSQGTKSMAFSKTFSNTNNGFNQFINQSKFNGSPVFGNVSQEQQSLCVDSI